MSWFNSMSCSSPADRRDLSFTGCFVEEPEVLQAGSLIPNTVHGDCWLEPSSARARTPCEALEVVAWSPHAGTVGQTSRLMSPHRHQDSVQVRLSGESTVSPALGQKLVWRGC